MILQASHQDQKATIFWHIDDQFIGQTEGRHQQSVWLSAGNHILSVMDSDGNKVSVEFEVIGEE